MPRSSRQWTNRRPHNHRKETQTAVVWPCLPFIRSRQNHLARRSERGKKTRQREEEVGRQHQGMDRPGVHQVPEDSGEQLKMEATGCKEISSNSISSSHHHHLSLNHQGHWGTTNDFTTSFLHFPLFCIALRDLVNSRPVHSLMLSSHLFLCLHCLLPPFIVPCKIVLARPDERET